MFLPWIWQNLRFFHAINSIAFVCYAVQKEDVMAENEVILRQRNSLGFDIQIKLLDGRELQVVSKGKKAKQTYSVDILSLQDKSKKMFFIAWKWLFAGVSFFLFTLLMLKVLPPYLSGNKNLYLGIILFAGILGGVLCFFQFWKHTSKKQIFYSRNAHIPIIELKVGKPSKEKFSAFINALEQRIKKFRAHMDLAEDKQLVGEMKMLRRLSDDGVISKKNYEAAKTKLFSGFDSQVINRDNQV